MSFWLIFGGVIVVGYLLLRRFAIVGKSCTSKARLDGKTVIVTGANTGIGKETAKDMARRGARVILACRDTSKADKAAQEIRQDTGSTNIVVHKLNLASLQSVRDFSQKILDEENRLDILINNAGIMMCPQWETEDGFEMQMGTNHLGPFLLTNLFLDLIKKSAPSRIVNVSSTAHSLFTPAGGIDFDDINCKKSYDPMAAYGKSKLANILFTRALAKRLKGTGVTTYSLHPGSIQTDLQRTAADQYFWAPLLFNKFTYAFFFKTPTQGAQTSIFCAVDESVANSSGKYYDGGST
ncbi:retinol dehydrogenase 13-like isoform X2 [Amphiura filiformis]|uniref:retinol dehydrogenase 13-like isoform X2 n=1 Tax=Amphiura filiformis TaxID=82378 RepID=UPI003B2231D6